jgi:thiamine-phosphate diphosphorylase
MRSPFLYYITREDSEFSHAEQAQALCKAGVRWIQLRLKGRPLDEWMDIAKQVVSTCRAYGARCIINDSFEVARISGADGVHLGAKDPDPAVARAELGSGAIIGATVHNAQEAQIALGMPVDYIGIGPCRFTTTKSDLSPLLGLDGAVEICRQIKSHRPELLTVAVGGLEVADARHLGEGGFDGIAMSGALFTRVQMAPLDDPFF